MEHTQGDWKIDRLKDCIRMNGVIICKLGHNTAGLMMPENQEKADEANAKLIAAAPETKRQRDELLDIMVSIERYTHSNASPKCIIDLIRLLAKGTVEAAN